MTDSQQVVQQNESGQKVFKPGALNLISDVPGVLVGNASDCAAETGVTVIRCEHAMTAAVDIRGGGPGTRETALLSSENYVKQVNSLVFSGGSVFGLAAADAVLTELSKQGVGLDITDNTRAIPIVPAAVLYDLHVDPNRHWSNASPYYDLGIAALLDATEQFSLGSVGAGTGAKAGLAKGGIGSTSIDLGEGIIVGALVAVNSVGSPLLPDGKSFYAWQYELADEFGGCAPPTQKFELSDPFADGTRLSMDGRIKTGANTTLATIATTVDLSVSELKRVAMMAHDGMARAVRPIHTPFDGDIVFSLSNGQVSAPKDDSIARAMLVAQIGSAAADCLARAIARGVYQARKANQSAEANA